MRVFIALMLAFIVTGSVSACGKRGPLTLPQAMLVEAADMKLGVNG